MESRSSLRQLHQQLGDSSGHSSTTRTNSGGSNRNHDWSWRLPDKRVTCTPPLPSLPPWTANSNQLIHQERHGNNHESLTSMPPRLTRHRPYFTAMKQLPVEPQHYQENDEPTYEQQHTNDSSEQEASSSVDSRQNKSLNEEEEVLTSSGSGSESNQQEERRLLPVRGQFFRPWKKGPSMLDAHDDDSSNSGDWSSISNKWKERAIMDPFAKRRSRAQSTQPPPKPQSPPDPPREVKKTSSARASTSRTKVSAQCPLNPLRVSSADQRRAALRPTTPVLTPLSPPPVPVYSSRIRIPRDTSHETLGQKEGSHNDSEPGNGSQGGKKPLKRSTVDALNEIKRKREARRAFQAEEKLRVQTELKEHGDDAGYKFRRLIRQYRDALPPSQQQQLTQLPPLALSSSIRPPPTPTAMVNAADTTRLSVFIRKRPLAKKELKAKGYDIISCLFAAENQSSENDNASLCRRELVCHEPKLRVDCSETLENHEFHFDGVFDEWQENRKLYDATVGPLVPYLVSETSATTSLTVFAYGQTGSGKTYTMKSIYRQAAVDLFHQLDEMKENSTSRRKPQVAVGVSFYEIYMNNVNDLFNGRKRVQLMEDGEGAVQMPGLKELTATNAEELLELVQRGEQARATSANAVHDESSRSHALLRITLYAEDNNNGPALARLSMVDLAGSERASDTQSDKKSTRMEGAEINKSLLALKECIRALNRGATHIPFRQSKLTQLLRDSFLSHNSKTIMIATVSPCSESCNHTLNTLRYADRLKEIGAS